MRMFSKLQWALENYVFFRICYRFVLWLPPVAILAIFLYSWFILCVLFCYVQLVQIVGAYFLAALLFSVFNLFFGLTMTSFYRAVYSDPGSVPDAYYERAEAHFATLTPEECQRYVICRTCDKLKPPRSHHCRHCRKCIRKMDHHCPVINNCVGWGNYKYFVLLLTWACVMCAYGVFCGIIKLFVVGFQVRHLHELGSGTELLIRVQQPSSSK